MNEEQAMVIAKSLAEASKLGTINALMCIQKMLEGYKTFKVPIISSDGQYCYGETQPYKQNREVQMFIDFMLLYLGETIKGLNKENKYETNKKRIKDKKKAQERS